MRTLALACLAALVGCGPAPAVDAGLKLPPPIVRRAPQVLHTLTLPSGGVIHVFLIPDSDITDTRCMIVVNEQGQPQTPLCLGSSISH